MPNIVMDVRRIRDFGIGTYIRSLIHALGAIDSVNHYLLVALPDDVHSLKGLPANFAVAIYRRTDSDALDQVTFPLFLRRVSADLYHIPLNRVPLLMPKPYVVTIHDMGSLLFEERTGIRKDLWRHRLRRGLRRASRVIVVSAATRRDVCNILGIPGDRIRLVYNAPNPTFFLNNGTRDENGAAARQRILERYQIHYPFVLYAGNIRPQKNIPRLVEAFAVVRSQLADHPQYRDLRLIIIGDEISGNPAVRQAVMKSRVEQAVRFLGFVPFDTLRCFYESAAVFAFPSLYEGFGLPPLEAMAAGTPVVTSNISALPEVVGGAAMLVNPENVFDIARGIREVLLDEELRQTLIRRGREHAATFSWERTAREVMEVYQEVANSE